MDGPLTAHFAEKSQTSSPPNLATTSSFRQVCRRISAVCMSSLVSPAWPNVSFTLLKLSRSSIKMRLNSIHPQKQVYAFSKAAVMYTRQHIRITLCFQLFLADWVYTSCFLLVPLSLNANIMFSLSDMASLLSIQTMRLLYRISCSTLCCIISPCLRTISKFI